MAKGKVPRRRYAEDFKRKIVAEANAADVSVSEIARRQANIYHQRSQTHFFGWWQYERRADVGASFILKHDDALH